MARHYVVRDAHVDAFLHFAGKIGADLRRDAGSMTGLPGRTSITGHATVAQDRLIRAWQAGVMAAMVAADRTRNALDLAQAALPDGTERERCIEAMRLLDGVS